jgi:hypothetical protein
MARELITAVRPSKPISEMTAEERRAFVDAVVARIIRQSR